MRSSPLTKYGKVAVLMGGWSAEREISLMSGVECYNALISIGVDAHQIDVDRNVIEVLKLGGFDRVFNMLHGRGGEDGEIQGALQINQIPYTGSGLLGSALAHDKLRSKQVCAANGVNTPAWKVVESYEECLNAVNSIGLPLVIKPSVEGSSIGVTIVIDEAQLNEAWDCASKYGVVLAEKFVQGVEITVGILGEHALPVVSMSTPEGFYDYHAKYFSEETRYDCPSVLEEIVEKKVQKIALEAFNLLGGQGWGRVDFMVDAENEPYFIELNSVPGMTTHSLVPMAAREMGLDFEQLCLKILDSSFGERK